MSTGYKKTYYNIIGVSPYIFLYVFIGNYMRKCLEEDLHGIGGAVDYYRTLSVQYCRTKILQGFSYRILPIDQFGNDDFLCTITDAVHSSYPCHLLACFQHLCHALSGFHLLNDKFKATFVPARSNLPNMSTVRR